MQSQMKSIRGGSSGIRPVSRTSVSRRALTVKSQKCLIVNTKGGGHAFVGLHLAKQLLKKGHDVTIMNDGDEAKLTQKDPFQQYSRELPQLANQVSRSVSVAWANPTEPSSWPASCKGHFDVVYDNNGKDLASCKPIIDAFKNTVKNYVFVGSAGAYNADSIEPCHYEGDTRKSSAGHVEVEKYLEKLRLPYTVFQPLYIYGPNTAKDCEQWFMDRIARDRPVPIPAPGIQLVNLTHVEDVASMMAAVPGSIKAKFQHFNACSDRAISFVGIVNAISKAMGKQPNVVLYDPEALGVGKGAKAEGFPFRTTHFFANSDKAKEVLGWEPQHTFLDDVEGLVKAYLDSGRHKKDIDFSMDDRILSALGAEPKAFLRESARSDAPRIPFGTTPIAASVRAATKEDAPARNSSWTGLRSQYDSPVSRSLNGGAAPRAAPRAASPEPPLPPRRSESPPPRWASRSPSPAPRGLSTPKEGPARNSIWTSLRDQYDARSGRVMQGATADQAIPVVDVPAPAPVRRSVSPPPAAPEPRFARAASPAPASRSPAPAAGGEGRNTVWSSLRSQYDARSGRAFEGLSAADAAPAAPPPPRFASRSNSPPPRSSPEPVRAAPARATTPGGSWADLRGQY